jgi:hypothetical protein
MRHLQADNFIGTLFIKLLKENKTEISLKELNEIEKELDKELRKNNDTLIYVSTDDIYTIINTYNFFKLNNREGIIKLSDYSIERYNDNKEEFLDILDSYFQAGIPNDIFKTIIEVFKNIDKL